VALYAANVSRDIAGGIALARQAIESGAARARLQQFIAFSKAPT
jgi:anthranilate phosphoribosyltransferase